MMEGFWLLFPWNEFQTNRDKCLRRIISGSSMNVEHEVLSMIRRGSICEEME